MRPVVGSLLKLMVMALAASAAQAHAQDGPPPQFRTIPTPAPANEAFSAVFGVYTNGSSLGIWDPAFLEISGDRLTVVFNRGCGFICPGGGSFFREFPFMMPALREGAYTIAFVEGGVGTTIAEFNFTVGAPAPQPYPVPGPGIWALLVLTLVIVAMGSVLTSKRARINTLNGTDS